MTFKCAMCEQEKPKDQVYDASLGSFDEKFVSNPEDAVYVCFACSDAEAERQDKENEARRNYIANGGSAWDF